MFIYPCYEGPPAFRDHIIQWSLYTGFTVSITAADAVEPLFNKLIGPWEIWMKF